MKFPHALWHPQDDHFYHTDALQRLPCQGDLRHSTVRQLPNLNRGALAATL